MAKHDPRYSTRRWRDIRQAVLTRDLWRCTVDHLECEYKAPYSLMAKPRIAHVHHVHPPAEGGPFWDIRNLVAVCATFNIAERNQRWNRKVATVTPPSRAW